MTSALDARQIRTHRAADTATPWFSSCRSRTVRRFTSSIFSAGPSNPAITTACSAARTPPHRAEADAHRHVHLHGRCRRHYALRRRPAAAGGDGGDYKALEAAYRSLPQPGQPVLASLEGLITQRPSMEEGRPAQTALVIERFVAVWPRESCGNPLADSPCAAPIGSFCARANIPRLRPRSSAKRI